MSADDAEFRAELRAFVDAELPRDERFVHHRLEMMLKRAAQAWQRKLASCGWSVPPWPVEHGGTGWSAADERVGPNMTGPILIACGTDEQRSEHLPPIRGGERLWCQGYSEPGSGSDLAQLRTRARLYGGDYIVDDDATHFVVPAQADDGRPIYLVDRSAPGVTVRPYRIRDGGDAADVVLAGCVQPADARLLGAGVTDAAVDEAMTTSRIARTAEAAGMTLAGTYRTVVYTGEREQFGKPIGVFEVLQHRMADTAIAANQVAAMAALVAGDGGDPAEVARVAKAVAELGIATFKSCIQLHGGYGMTEDLPLGVGLRPMLTIALLF